MYPDELACEPVMARYWVVVGDLLKLSLISKTPLNEFIFKKKQIPCNLNSTTCQSEIRIGKSLPSDEVKQMVVKLQTFFLVFSLSNFNSDTVLESVDPKSRIFGGYMLEDH
jgi:hypothetical protein